MQLISFLFVALASLLTFASANSVHFYNLNDGKTRGVCWYPAPYNGDPKTPRPPVPGTHLEPGANVYVPLPANWVGKFNVVLEGGDCTWKGWMEGELVFQGFHGHTYYAISGVTPQNANLPFNNDGIKYLRPVGSKHPLVGCSNFPCNGIWTTNQWDANRSTPEVDLEAYAGNVGGQWT